MKRLQDSDAFWFAVCVGIGLIAFVGAAATVLVALASGQVQP